MKFLIAVLTALVSGCGQHYYSDEVVSALPCSIGQSSMDADIAVQHQGECTDSTSPIVRLRLLDDEDNERVCTGLLVSKDTILSAGHCFDENVFTVLIDLGNHSYPSTTVVTHPGLTFSLERGDNDVAIVTFQPTQDSFFTEPSSYRVSVTPPELGEELYFLGYGRGIDDNSSRPRTLRFGVMRVSTISGQFIDAQYSGAGTTSCYGDSGGPALVKRGNTFHLVGIVSGGTKQDCSIGDTAYFTNLNHPSIRSFLTQRIPYLYH
jgi:chymotrypsin-like protease